MTSPYRAKRRFSQNFFQDPALLQAALAPLELQASDHVLEIGPGQGVLTQILLEQVAEVWAIEYDRDLYALLAERWPDHPRLKLLQQDFMAFELELFKVTAPLAQRKLLANIPYHLTSPILLKVLNQASFSTGLSPESAYFSDICLMVQKEVAEKLIARPGNKNHGVLTLNVQFAAEVELLEVFSRDLFYPRPQVDSALIRLRPRLATPVSTPHLALMWRLVGGIYQQRRKTLRNALRSLQFEASVLEQLAQNWDLSARGEKFDLLTLSRLSDDLAALL